MDGKHNLIKISSLYFLKLQRLTGKEGATAGKIAAATGANPDSLYVLLSRWDKWGLIKRIWIKPYSYALANQGVRYLDRLDRWYKDKEDVFRNVLETASISFYWITLNKDNKAVQANILKYPFQNAEDYVVVKADQFGKMNYLGSNLLIKKGNALQAVNGIKDDIGLTWGKPLIDALVDAKFLSYN